ncbi:hypothetical protein C7M84_025297 [Penaeus vannamei]|uniref:C2H2-type domain-containing protein n=1 Tax=Penaeus vannamei TaxID=6689 RepID=A0A3R7NA65_PENVA|nr:hypothetical protein C7M84_025297 [Penaeus vannamei]
MHQCPFCTYSSVFMNNMRKHVRTHTGEKPYVCPRCPFRANQNSSLKRHMVNIHNDGEGVNQEKISTEELKSTEPPLQAGTTGSLGTPEGLHSAGERRLFSTTSLHHSPDYAYNNTDENLVLAHAVPHKGGRPYSCAQCPYRAISNLDLETASRNSHECAWMSCYLQGMVLKDLWILYRGRVCRPRRAQVLTPLLLSRSLIYLYVYLLISFPVYLFAFLLSSFSLLLFSQHWTHFHHPDFRGVSIDQGSHGFCLQNSVSIFKFCSCGNDSEVHIPNRYERYRTIFRRVSAEPAALPTTTDVLSAPTPSLLHLCFSDTSGHTQERSPSPAPTVHSAPPGTATSRRTCSFTLWQGGVLRKLSTKPHEL